MMCDICIRIRRYMMAVILLLSFGLPFESGAEEKETVSVSDPANLTGNEYSNPVIHADYSDPDVVASADGKTFYMTSSSFQCIPGLPILKSEDLVNWELTGYALKSVPRSDCYGGIPRHGKGVWAPCIRLHDGMYHIYWGDPDFGVFLIRTTDPEGEWSDPVLVKAGKGMIDPTPLWDDDCKVYLANGWAASRVGFNSVITISEMNADGTKVISSPRIVFDGNDGVNHTVEGPKIYKKDGYYYLFSPAGGVTDGWQLVMRSENIYGPYESKIVMAQGGSSINGPHQGGWVRTAAGEDWFLHFQDKGAYGRVVHLNPMDWKDGWPVIGLDAEGDGCGEPVERHVRPAVASMSVKTAASGVGATCMSDKNVLYQWHSNYDDSFGFRLPDGMMRIYGHRLTGDSVNMWEVPNLWLKKFPAERFTLTSKVRVSAKSTSDGVSSGIIVMGWDYARLGLEKRGDRFVVEFVECADAEHNGKEVRREIKSVDPTRIYPAGLYPNMEIDVYLRVIVSEGGICRFSYSLDGKRFDDCGKFKSRAGKWIGAKVGFYSVAPAGMAEKGWCDVVAVETAL